MNDADERQSAEIFAYFLIPLRVLLRLADKELVTLAQRRGYDSDWYEDSPRESVSYDPDEILSLVRIRHHITPSGPISTALDLMELQESVLPWVKRADPTLPTPDASGPVRKESVLEVAVQIRDRSILDQPDQSGGAELFPPLLEAITAVQQLQRVYHLSTREAIPLVTAASLPMIIPCHFAEETESGPVDRGGHGILNFNSAELLGQSDEVISGESLIAANQQWHPLLRYLDLMRESEWTLRSSGDAWASLVLSATAAEFLIQTLVRLLLWEQGVEPEAATKYFSIRRGPMKQATSGLSRLGGDWSSTDNPALRNWQERVLYKRNSAIHRAAGVSGREAAEALSAVIDLQRFISDRLRPPNVAKYPVSALVVVGVPDLKARGVWGPKLEDVARTADEYLSRFIRWSEASAKRSQDPD